MFTISRKGFLRIKLHVMNLLLLTIAFACSSQSTLPELKVVDERFSDQIFSPLSEIIRSDYDITRSVVALKVVEMGDEYEARATILYKDDFSWYLAGKEDKIIGWTRHENSLVLIFGSAEESFFRKMNHAQSFDFLEIIDFEGNTDSSGIDIEPDMFEPTVWVFMVTKNDIKLKEKGELQFLE